MAGKSFIVIDLAALAEVTGGIEKDTAALQAKIRQATSAMQDLARQTQPKDNSLMQMMLGQLPGRGSNSGPTPAPALPPTSTLTR